MKKKPAASRRRRNTPRPAPVRHTLFDGLEGRGADLSGLFLIVVGILSALGIYAGTSGLLGAGINDFFGWGVGVFRYFAP
ncbi:MAG: hypothetical protein HKN94_14445, partial [Acidimicrobiales bacterium]|nr:hypothetical protein [Acidimicrobiales bacterium]